MNHETLTDTDSTVFITDDVFNVKCMIYTEEKCKHKEFASAHKSAFRKQMNHEPRTDTDTQFS